MDGVERRQNRGVGEERRRQKSLRNGVHHADAVVWGPVYRTRLNLVRVSRPLARAVERRGDLLHAVPLVALLRAHEPRLAGFRPTDAFLEVEVIREEKFVRRRRELAASRRRRRQKNRKIIPAAISAADVEAGNASDAAVFSSSITTSPRPASNFAPQSHAARAREVRAHQQLRLVERVPTRQLRARLGSRRRRRRSPAADAERGGDVRGRVVRVLAAAQEGGVALERRRARA
eukprot:31455-Pelagococcus_subviridis.AAC.5